MTQELSLVDQVNKDLNMQMSSPNTMKVLLATTFKGFKDPVQVQQACFEIMTRGYKFEDIVKKKIYAIPFGQSYSIVQSIGDVRSIAMRSGQVGKSAPEYEVDDKGKIIACTITVQRMVQGYVGNYTATAYFDEYYKAGKTYQNKYTPSQWDIRPRTMIAKVAEMHALRMAFPDELDQTYVEEEFQKDPVAEQKERVDNAKVDTGNLAIGNFEKKKPKDAVVDDEIPIVGMDDEEEVLPEIDLDKQ